MRSSVSASAVWMSSVSNMRASFLASASGRAPRTVTRGGSSGLGASSSTLSSTQVPSAAQRWKLSTSDSSKQAALNWPEVSEKSARTNSPPRRVRPLETPSTIAAITAGMRPPPGTPDFHQVGIGARAVGAGNAAELFDRVGGEVEPEVLALGSHLLGAGPGFGIGQPQGWLFVVLAAEQAVLSALTLAHRRIGNAEQEVGVGEDHVRGWAQGYRTRPPQRDLQAGGGSSPRAACG